MPESPFKRVVEEGLVQPEGSSLDGEKSKRKRKSKPTSSRRAKKQKTKERYSKAREDAQLLGLIPTTPEGALKPERTQSELALPSLVREALKENWATPDSAKPAIVAALLEPFYKDDVVIDENGNAVHVKPSRKMLMELAKTLILLDKTQFDRDHPEAAGKARGASNGASMFVNVQTNIEAAKAIREMIERGELGIIEEVQPSHIPSPSSSSGQQREVAGSATSEDDEQCAGEGVEDTE